MKNQSEAITRWAQCVENGAKSPSCAPDIINTTASYSARTVMLSFFSFFSLSLFFLRGSHRHRRVEDITEALWGTRVSPSAVSDLNKKI